MNGVFRRLGGITRWVVCFLEEVDRGIAVGRGYTPVVKNTWRGLVASRSGGARTTRGRVLAHRAGRRGTGGRA